jgi:hypothetical protein
MKVQMTLIKGLNSFLVLFVSTLVACAPPLNDRSKEQVQDMSFLSGVRAAWERSWKYPIVQLPENLRLATTKFGLLKVSEGSFKYSVPKNKRPWSSWWQPLRDRSLFEGQQAPLVKFDRIQQALGKSSTVAARFVQRAMGEAATWEGLCDSWALASIFEYEPSKFLKVGNTCLTPGDQKALLAVAYKDSGTDLKNNYFGQMNRNSNQDIYSDIYPDQLHSLLQHELRDRGSSIIIDTDPGVEVWNTPVYEAEFQIKKLSEDSVSVTLLLSSPEYQLNEEQKAQDKIGSLGNLFTKRNYTYVLYGTWLGNVFQVGGGEWTGTSEKNHPDYAIALPSNNQMMIEKSQSLNNEQLRYTDLVQVIRSGSPVQSCQ